MGHGSFKDETLKCRKNVRQMHSQDERGKPGKMDNWIGDSIGYGRDRGGKGGVFPD